MTFCLRSNLVCFVIAYLACKGDLSALTEREYENIWQVDTSYMTPMKREEWRKQVRETEGLQTHLMGRIGQAWEVRDAESLRLLFGALEHRVDLRSEELAALAKPVEEMLRQGVHTTRDDRASVMYALGFVRTIGSYPSDRHEELAIALAASSDGGVYVNAAQTLAKIGDKKALEALRKLVDRVKPPPGKADIFIGEVLTAMYDLERRLARAESAKIEGDSASSTGALKAEHLASNEVSEAPSSGGGRIVSHSASAWWVAAIIVFLLLLAIFIRNRCRKSDNP